jgi:hypothetical protein
MNNSTNNRIVSPDTTIEMTTGYCVGIEDKVEVDTIYGADMIEEVNLMANYPNAYEDNKSEWSSVAFEQLLYNNVLNCPLVNYDAQRDICGWNDLCEQARFNTTTINTNTSVIIDREWRRFIYVKACMFMSTQQIPTSMISLAFAMLDRYHNCNREHLELHELTIAFLACFIFAIETHMSLNIFPMIASGVDGTCSIPQLINMGEQIRKFFLSTMIGNEYGCIPLNTTEYSQPIIPERLIHTLELYNISNVLGVDCSLLLDQAKHVASGCVITSLRSRQQWECSKLQWTMTSSHLSVRNH